MLVRYASAILIASGVTFGLFFLMQALVVTDEVSLSDIQTVRFVDVVRVDQQQQPKTEERQVDRPPPPDAPPPELDLPQASADVAAGGLNFGDLALESGVDAMGPQLGGPSDGDYLPLVRIQPQYPRRAAERGIEGYVVVELTVTPQGTTQDVQVIEADPQGYFERAATRAAEKFKYKPKVVNGQPVSVQGVQYVFTFRLDES